VELIEVKRHLETKNKYALNLQRSGLIKERPLTPDEPLEGYEDPVYDPAAWDSVSEEFRDYTLEKLVHNRLELEHFKQFLAEKVSWRSQSQSLFQSQNHFIHLKTNFKRCGLGLSFTLIDTNLHAVYKIRAPADIFSTCIVVANMTISRCMGVFLRMNIYFKKIMILFSVNFAENSESKLESTCFIRRLEFSFRSGCSFDSLS
jgi:hypothetical protein